MRLLMRILFCSHNGGVHGAPARKRRGCWGPASDEPGYGAEPHVSKSQKSNPGLPDPGRVAQAPRDQCSLTRGRRPTIPPEHPVPPEAGAAALQPCLAISRTPKRRIGVTQESAGESTDITLRP
jgi:hypothetical protein